MTPAFERGVSVAAGLIWSGFWVAVVKKSNTLTNTSVYNTDWFIARENWFS